MNNVGFQFGESDLLNETFLTADFEIWKSQVSACRVLEETDTCRDLLNRGLKTFGMRAGCKIFAAETFAAIGEFMEALQCYDEACSAEDASANQNMDSVSGAFLGSNSGLGTDSSAAGALEAQIEALLCSAVLLSELGYYDEAQMRFQAVCDLDTDGGERYFGKSLIPEGASLCALRAKSLELVGWARRAWLKGDSESALSAVQKAQGLIDSAEVRLCLAQFLMVLGDPARALENLEWGRRLEPSRAEFQLIAARCFLLLGKTKQAKDAMLRAELLGDTSLAGRALRIESKSW